MDSTGPRTTESVKVTTNITLTMSSPETAIDLTSSSSKRSRTDSTDSEAGTVPFLRPRIKVGRTCLATARDLQKEGLAAPNDNPNGSGVRHSGPSHNFIARMVQEVSEQCTLSGATTPQEYHEERLHILTHTHAHYSDGPPSMAKDYNITLVDLTAQLPPGTRTHASRSHHTVMSYHFSDPTTVHNYKKPRRFIFFIVGPVPYENSTMHLFHRLTGNQLRLLAKGKLLALEQIFDIPALQAAYNPGS